MHYCTDCYKAFCQDCIMTGYNLSTTDVPTIALIPSVRIVHSMRRTRLTPCSRVVLSDIIYTIAYL
jgi:hypothetical protein